MPIRTRLLFLVLSLIIPAFIAAMLAVGFVYKEMSDARKKSLAEAATAMSLLIDNTMQTTEGILRTLASSPALEQGDLNAFYDHARRIAPPEYSVVVLMDLSGKQLLNTRVTFGASLPKSSSNLPALRARYGSMQTVVSDLFFAPVGKRYDFAIQIPVIRDNQVQYYLAMGVAVDRLRPLLDSMNLPEGWLVSVTDRNGTVVARSSTPGKFVGQTVREKLLVRIQAQESAGIHYGTTLDNMKTAAFFQRSAFSDWTVIVNVPLSEIRRPGFYAAGFLGAMMLLLMAAAVLAAHLYARRIAQPIEQLRATADRLGRGEAIAASATGMTETDTVDLAMARASTQLQQNRAELEQRVAEAVDAAERAQQALLQGQKREALGRLTAGIAHDFNNILQTLSSGLQLISLCSDHPRVRDVVETCNRAVDRATVLTGQMRSFGKLQDANLQTIRAADAIQGALPLLKNALPANCTLVLEIDATAWPVTVDVLQLEMTLLNIVINARDAMPGGGTIRIAVGNVTLPEPVDRLALGDYVRITVTDSGAGMSAEVLSRAVEPFFTTKSVDQGSGLGLAQAYGFAIQSKGLLLLDSAENQGSTVTIYLPRAPAGMTGEAPQTKAPHEPGVKKSLLFVEDDSLVREAVTPALSNAGFDVIVAKNGEEALAVLESGQGVQIVFSDIVMPGRLNGIDLAKTIRQRFASVHVVLATGYTDAPIDAPGVQVIAKPYSIDEVVKLLLSRDAAENG